MTAPKLDFGLLPGLDRCETCGSPFIEIEAWYFMNHLLENCSEGPCTDPACHDCDECDGTRYGDTPLRLQEVRDWRQYRQARGMDPLEQEDQQFLRMMRDSQESDEKAMALRREFLAQYAPEERREEGTRP